MIQQRQEWFYHGYNKELKKQGRKLVMITLLTQYDQKRDCLLYRLYLSGK